MSIKARLMLLILVAAFPVLVLFAWSELETRSQRLDLAAADLQRSARLLAAQQDQFFQRAESILRTKRMVPRFEAASSLDTTMRPAGRPGTCRRTSV